MVGPDSETEGRGASCLQLCQRRCPGDGSLSCVCVRKGFGLGAQGMAGGSFAASQFTIAWPTGQFGPMGIEGGVELGL